MDATFNAFCEIQLAKIRQSHWTYQQIVTPKPTIWQRGQITRMANEQIAGRRYFRRARHEQQRELFAEAYS
jgi:hypothetical protein